MTIGSARPPVVAIFLAVLIAQEAARRGDTTWYKGLQLLAVYAVLALTLFV